MNPKAFIKKHHDKRIRNGHLWVYSNEIERIEGECSGGDIIDIHLADDSFFAKGFYNKHSLISLRILSYKKSKKLKDLFQERFQKAFELRNLLYPGKDSFRLVFGESDLLPGLIVDKYNSTFVLQVNSVGMERNIDIITGILKEDFNAKNIFTKSDSAFRKMEGLSEVDIIYSGAKEKEIISDGTVSFNVDFEASQKTGFYFDQTINRITASKLCSGKDVFDGFCNSGGFGLHALKQGAKSVTFADSSAEQLAQVRNNITLNSLSSDACHFHESDLFDLLEKLKSEDRSFDVVMIDPPAFAKNKKNIPTAIKGYRKLHKLAFGVIKGEGFLVTTSCSHHISESEFEDIINDAAVLSNRSLKLIHKASAAPDHPKLSSMPETAYLKFLIYHVSSMS